ncbi:MAG: mechanosensitive ion channel domain-containing protein [Myxococcota bacterium]|nr:mechanosensitive ion channel domain-containing protein [Myxococcota bacterium]
MDTSMLTETGQEAANQAIEMISTWGMQVVGAIALLIVGYFVAGRAGRMTRRALERGKLDAQLVPFFGQAVHYFVLAVVVIAVLQLFGIQTTSLVAVIGAAGLAVGLALQGTLSSFAAGVLLLVTRPFKTGDFVSVAGSTGSVSEITLFSTTLNTPDNIQIVIPNSSVYGTTITNFSANDIRRIDLVIGISYDDDIGKAIELIESILAKEELLLKDPSPTVAVSELADSSVNLIVRPWTNSKDFGSARASVVRSLKEGIEAGGCSFPYPQQDVHVVSSAAS